MFAFLEGIADSIDADRVIINVSGVGYELLCSRNTLDRIGKGEVVRLYTHFQLSQDAVALYGFVIAFMIIAKLPSFAEVLSSLI